MASLHKMSTKSQIGLLSPCTSMCACVRVCEFAQAHVCAL